MTPFEWVPLPHVLLEHKPSRPFQQGWSPRCLTRPAEPGEWGVLKTTAIQAGLFLEDQNKALPGTLAPRPQLEVRQGDILITCAGPRSRCGVPTLVRGTRPGLMLSGKMYRLRSNDRVLPEYLQYWLLSPAAQRSIDTMKTGISESGLNLTHDRFATLLVPVATVQEQGRIVEIIEDHFSRLDAATSGLDLALLRARALSAASARDWLWAAPARAPFGRLFAPAKAPSATVPQTAYATSGAFEIVDQGDHEISYTDDVRAVYAGPFPVLIFGDHTRRAKYRTSPFAVGAQGVKLLHSLVHPRFAYWCLATAPIESRGYGRHYARLRATDFPLLALGRQREVADRLDLIDEQAHRLEGLVVAAQDRGMRLRRAILAAAFSGRLTGHASDADQIEEIADADS